MNKAHRHWRLAASAVALALMPGIAEAWESGAQRAITEGSIRVIRQKYDNAFKSENEDFVADVVRGAEDGWRVLRGSDLLSRERVAIERVGTEIKLLRSVRGQGTGSYFAYRMGVLSSLVSDIVLPYGLEREGAGAQIRERVEQDVEAHLRSYSVQPLRGDIQIVRVPLDYFRDIREFHGDAYTLIAADYRHGKGYAGFMTQAAPKYFGDSIKAVAEVWNTILSTSPNLHDGAPSADTQTWYRVDEVGYQLQTKANPRQASRAYTYFSTINPGIPEAYEAVGDLFYQTGDERQGVREWEQALAYPGATRNRVANKLGEHYINMGQAALAKAQEDAGARDLELERALHNFEQALQFNRGSGEAVGMITETNEAIRERNEQRKLTVNLVTGAQDVIREAERARAEEDFSRAISTYESAIGLFGQVTADFPEQYALAESGVRDANGQIRTIIRSLLDRGSDAMSDGDILRDERKWDQARNRYQSVEDILRPVPDTDNVHAREKTEMIEKSREKLSELELEQKRVEAAEAAAAAGGAPRPATP